VTSRSRLDRALVRRGLAESRAVAAELIDEGRVTVDGAPALKPATMVASAQALHVTGAAERWASRAGHKLAGALEHLDADPAGRHCLDAGASTGGFTDVLLRAGAERVVAVDVGYGQLRWRLRTDPRVIVMDRTNVRHLTRADIGEPAPSLVVADLSFISLRLVLPALVDVAEAGADLVVMVKPQFEVGAGAVGTGGVVRDARAWRTAVEGIVGVGRDLGLSLHGATVSPLPGPSGNIEFFLHLGAAPASLVPAGLIERVITEGAVLAGRDRPDDERGDAND
jgi:23S rRNA (cytidine1920-2'-O)/16S rRNA (cytidine1409-2'-O)-methyltransferase